jgi:hypothetical protein
VGIRFNDVVLGVPSAAMSLGGINDGDTFAISVTSGAPNTVFEFDTDGITTPGNQIVQVAATATQNDVANAMVQALINADIGLSPKNLGQGRVQLGVEQPFRRRDGHAVTVAADRPLDPGRAGRADRRGDPQFDRQSIADLHAERPDPSRRQLGSRDRRLWSPGLDVIGRPGLSDPSAVEIAIFPSAAVSPIEVASLIRPRSTRRVSRADSTSPPASPMRAASTWSDRPSSPTSRTRPRCR